MKAKIPDIIVQITGSSSAVFTAASGECVVVSGDRRHDTAAALSAVIKDGGIRKAASVLVLSSDFFSQQVRLPSVQTRGLSHEELLSVLAFEVEPFSSIPRERGRIAYGPCRADGEFSVWDVVQISSAEADSIASVLKSAGLKPAGFGFAPDEPDQEQLKKELQEKYNAISAGRPGFALITGQVPGGGLASGNPAVPAVAAGLAAALLCLAHFIVMSLASVPLKAETGRREILAGEVGRISSEVSSVESRIKAVDAETAGRADDARKLRMRHTAWLSLLRALPAACGDKVVVRAIKPDGNFGAKVEAFSAAEDGSYMCMSRLSKLLRGTGWTVLPEHAAIAGSLGGIGPAQFSFRVKFSESAISPANGGAL